MQLNKFLDVKPEVAEAIAACTSRRVHRIRSSEHRAWMRSICDEMSDEKARFRQASHPQKSMPLLNSAPWKDRR